MRLNEERISHISHLILDKLMQDRNVDALQAECLGDFHRIDGHPEVMGIRVTVALGDGAADHDDHPGDAPRS